MKYRKLCLVMAVLMLLSMLSGCGEVVGEIADNVAETAKQELENQVKAAFEKYKVEVIEFKTTVGKLNGDSGDIQFFCAALVQSDSDKMPAEIAGNLSKMFHDAGLTVQVGSEIENSYLEHKNLSFKFTGFEDSKTYYTVWCYTDKLPSFSDLNNLTTPESKPGVG